MILADIDGKIAALPPPSPPPSPEHGLSWVLLIQTFHRKRCFMFLQRSYAHFSKFTVIVMTEMRRAHLQTLPSAIIKPACPDQVDVLCPSPQWRFLTNQLLHLVHGQGLGLQQIWLPPTPLMQNRTGLWFMLLKLMDHITWYICTAKTVSNFTRRVLPRMPKAEAASGGGREQRRPATWGSPNERHRTQPLITSRPSSQVCAQWRMCVVLASASSPVLVPLVTERSPAPQPSAQPHPEVRWRRLRGDWPALISSPHSHDSEASAVDRAGSSSRYRRRLRQRRESAAAAAAAPSMADLNRDRSSLM